MKLTDDKINAMAAELLGYCYHDWSGEEDVFDSDGDEHTLSKCVHCGEYELGCDWEDAPDCIYDANAVRELVRWLARQGRDVCTAFNEFLYVADDAWAVLNSLCRPVKHITLAVLYAAGKLTEQQAKEAMSDEL